jgi:hypothetical protein
MALALSLLCWSHSGSGVQFPFEHHRLWCHRPAIPVDRTVTRPAAASTGSPPYHVSRFTFHFS